MTEREHLNVLDEELCSLATEFWNFNNTKSQDSCTGFYPIIPFIQECNKAVNSEHKNKPD